MWNGLTDFGQPLSFGVLLLRIAVAVVIGAVVIMSREPRARFSDGEIRLATTAAGFLGRQMES